MRLPERTRPGAKRKGASALQNEGHESLSCSRSEYTHQTIQAAPLQGKLGFFASSSRTANQSERDAHHSLRRSCESSMRSGKLQLKHDKTLPGHERALACCAPVDHESGLGRHFPGCMMHAAYPATQAWQVASQVDGYVSLCAHNGHLTMLGNASRSPSLGN